MQRFHNVFRKTVCLTLLVTMMSWAAGCNTMAGLGHDIEKGGDAIEDAARDAQN